MQERFAAERRLVRAEPDVAFDARRVRAVSVGRNALVRVEGAWYSVPSRWAGLQATAYIGVDELTLSCRGEEVLYPRQRFGGRLVMYRHFLGELARILPGLEDEYVSAGLVSIEYRHLTFLGPYSNEAAAASECAAEQDLFWQYHDLLVTNPSSPVKDMALGLDGVDLGTFHTCVDSGKHAATVADATTEARARLRELGAESIGVPTFTVNDRFWRLGVPSMDELRSAIERAQEAGSAVAAAVAP